MRVIRSIAVLFSMATLAAAAYAQAPLEAKDGILVDSKGMTVYTFDPDKKTEGKSACNDQCAKNWPPVHASADAAPEGDYTIIERDDGTKQWAYKGQPLYTFIKDTKPGDRTGDNVKDVWHIVEQ